MYLLKEFLKRNLLAEADNININPDDESEDLLSPDNTEQGVGDDNLEGKGELDDTEEDPNDDNELEQVASKATENPDRQGVVRAVRGAHMVYKRQVEDGTYEELWVFNSPDTIAKNMHIRKAILAGTDIPTNKTSSPDGKQQYELWTAGNAELLNIKGLPQ